MTQNWQNKSLIVLLFSIVALVPLPKSNANTAMVSYNISDDKQVSCLAKNIFFEARGLSKREQYAVAFVTLNRANHHKFPESICDVVYQSKQFSWIRTVKQKESKKLRENKSWEQAYLIASEVYAKYNDLEDPTKGATHFFNPKLVKKSPTWAKYGYDKVKMSGHVYMKVREGKI